MVFIERYVAGITIDLKFLKSINSAALYREYIEKGGISRNDDFGLLKGNLYLRLKMLQSGFERHTSFLTEKIGNICMTKKELFCTLKKYRDYYKNLNFCSLEYKFFYILSRLLDFSEYVRINKSLLCSILFCIETGDYENFEVVYSMIIYISKGMMIEFTNPNRHILCGNVLKIANDFLTLADYNYVVCDNAIHDFREIVSFINSCDYAGNIIIFKVNKMLVNKKIILILND